MGGEEESDKLKKRESGGELKLEGLRGRWREKGNQERNQEGKGYLNGKEE